MLDAVKEVSFVETFESSLKAIYSFYHRSPKHLREMREVADVLHEHTVKPGGIFAVRWVASKLQAVQAMKKNWYTIVVHLQQLSQGSTVDATKAKGMLKSIFFC